jgi:hypothetical protein
MATKSKRASSLEATVTPPLDSDFTGQQLDLFKTFICNGDAARDRLSNAFDLWDSVPRYAVSRQQMDKTRKTKGFLDLLQLDFNYRGEPMLATIQAARIIDEATGVSKDFYPSANEELIEDALRKIAAEPENGFYAKSEFRSGVVFTLYALRKELESRGHTRSYQEIVLSLKILARSTIEISKRDGKRGEGFSLSPFLTGLSAVSRSKLNEDPESRWIAQFHPLVTLAIDAITFRQYNYAQMMSHKNQLTRWLHKQLSLKFTFASFSTSFEIRYSTIKRDSGLLDSYSRERKAIETLDDCIKELEASRVLSKSEKVPVTGPRGKVLDVVYTFYPSPDFIKDMKASNKRAQVQSNSPITTAVNK